MGHHNCTDYFHAIQVFSRKIQGRNEDLKKQRERADRLLFKILPEKVARDLKKNKRVSFTGILTQSMSYLGMGSTFNHQHKFLGNSGIDKEILIY